ncbi:hypothetical protein [Blastococcus sp. SYSU DS0617]
MIATVTVRRYRHPPEAPAVIAVDPLGPDAPTVRLARIENSEITIE